MSQLRYIPDSSVEDLQVGECTMHRAINSDGSRYWHLWFRVNREDNGEPADFCVPMNPHGGFIEAGPGGKTWGLTPTGPGEWQVSPSINVLNTRELHPGAHDAPSLWHQTPAIVEVPEGLPWITEAP